MKILILGHNGMLGHMVIKYFKSKGYSVETTNHRWPSEEFCEFIKKSKCRFIINCIGLIPQKESQNEWDVFEWHDYKSINVNLPIFLAKKSNAILIQPSTDCEFNGSLEHRKWLQPYKVSDIPTELDDYGLSKSVATNILSQFNNVNIIRSCIIGPEINSSFGLFEWFKNSSEESVNGYTNVYINCITTLKWAELVYEIINTKQSKLSSLLTFNKNNSQKIDNIFQFGTDESNSKFQILKSIRDIFDIKKEIKPREVNVDLPFNISTKVLEYYSPIKSTLLLPAHLPLHCVCSKTIVFKINS